MAGRVIREPYYPQPQTGWRAGMDLNAPRPPARSQMLGGAAPSYGGSYGGEVPQQEYDAYQQAAQLQQQMIAQGYSPEEAGRAASEAYQSSTASTAQPSAPTPSGLPAAPTRDMSFGGPSQYKADYTTKDPYKMAVGDRTVIADRGNNIDTDLRSEEQYRAGMEGRYRGAADTAYGDLQQTPGYTGQEAAEIRGDTGSYKQYFDPQNLQRYDDESAQAQRQQLDNAKSDMFGATGIQNDTLTNANTAYRDSAIANTLTGEGNVRGAIDYNKLSLDKNFAPRYEMSDKDVQDIVNAAGTNVANRYGGAEWQLNRDAAASGMASPMAVAAGRERLMRDSAVQGADAMTNARIAAKAEQASRLKDSEQMRLSAEQGYSNLRAPAEERLMQSRLAVGQQMRDNEATAANAVAANRLDTSRFVGGTGVGMEQGIGSARADTGRYITNTGTGINQTADQARSERGAQIAGARMGGQQEYRGYVTGQTNQQVAAGQAATENRIKNYGVQSEGQNQATRGTQQYDLGRRGQSFGTNFKGSLGSSMGKGLGAFATS